jgi:sugar phosphate isomerase/epimerase
VPHTGVFDEAVMKKTAEDFNRWGEACQDAGLVFAYHPHGYEFTPGSRPGETLFDDLVRDTKSKAVSFELDVFWAVHAGADPVKLLEKYSTRWIALHIKDIRKGAPVGLTTGHAPDTDNVTVGDGQIDWKTVLATAQKLGVKYYFIEDETPSPLECIPGSLAFLRTLKF